MKKETLIKCDIRMYPSDWEKLKQLKIKSELPWPSLIKMANRIIESSFTKGEDKYAETTSKDR